MKVTEIAVENGLLTPMYVVVMVRADALEIRLKKDRDENGSRVMPGQRCVIPVDDDIRRCYREDGSLDYEIWNHLGTPIVPPEPVRQGARHTFVIEDGRKN